MNCVIYTLCYANDIALLVPCSSAMIYICYGYSVSHRLKFNADKTQLSLVWLSRLLMLFYLTVFPCSFSDVQGASS